MHVPGSGTAVLLDAVDRAVVIEPYPRFARDHVRHLETQAADLLRHAEYGFGEEAGRRYPPQVFTHLVDV